MHACFKHNVEDFDTFMKELQKLNIPCDYSSMTVYRDADDPNHVAVMVFDVDQEQVTEFCNSQEFRNDLARVGAIGEPDMMFLHEIKTLAHAHH